jgi:spermidine synthase
MVGPFAIKLATSRLDGVGTGAGSIYAVSTLGSVVGTLVLGFFLFPLVGAREILVGTGLVLSMLAMLVAFYERRRSPQIAIMPSALFAVAGMLLLPKALGAGEAYTGGGAFKILSERESLYGWVRVVEQPTRDLRFLTSDASMIGAASLSTGKGRLSYQHIVGMIPSLRSGMSRALIVGLGAGHMAKILQERYGITADTLEIDPAVQDAAMAYFDFKPTGKAIVGDARYEIRHLQGPYDLIIHDCFTGGSEPAHLLTVEALQQLRGLLSEHGVLAVNFVSFLSGGRNPALASVAKTVSEVFPHYSVFASEPGDDFNDFIFLASRQSIDLSSPALSQEQTAWLQARALTVEPTNGSVLTDNLNPLEHLQTAKAEHYRHVVIDWFGPELLLR